MLSFKITMLHSVGAQVYVFLHVSVSVYMHVWFEWINGPVGSICYERSWPESAIPALHGQCSCTLNAPQRTDLKYSEMDGIKNWGKSASQSALHYFGFFECSWIVQTAHDWCTSRRAFTMSVLSHSPVSEINILLGFWSPDHSLSNRSSSLSFL